MHYNGKGSVRGLDLQSPSFVSEMDILYISTGNEEEKLHIEISIYDLEKEFSRIQQNYIDQPSTANIHTLRAQCSALNPEVLQEMIRETGSEECEQLMRSYMSKLQSFQRQTKLRSFKGSAKELGLAPRDYRRLHVEFQGDWINKTLEDLEVFRQYIPWKPCIMNRIVVIAESLTVVFSIPKPEEPLKLDSLANYLKTGQVRRIAIAGECIFPRKEISTAEKLLLACKSGGISLIEELLNSKVVSESDLPYQDECGNSPLMLASLFGNTEVVRLLLSRRPDVNFKNINGQTALMLACEYGYESIVLMLLDYGAKVESESNDNKYTALTYAASGGHKRVIEILFSHGAKVNDKASEVATDPSVQKLLENHRTLCDLKQKSQMGFAGMLSGLMDLVKIQDGVGLKHTFETLFEGSSKQHVSPLEDKQHQPESESGKFPSMNSSFQLLLPVANEWENLGLLLNVPDGKLQAIGSQYRGSERNCLREMLRAWFSGSSGSHTWEALADGVKPINSDIADQIMSKSSSPTLVHDTTVD